MSANPAVQGRRAATSRKLPVADVQQLTRYSIGIRGESPLNRPRPLGCSRSAGQRAGRARGPGAAALRGCPQDLLPWRHTLPPVRPLESARGAGRDGAAAHAGTDQSCEAKMERLLLLARRAFEGWAYRPGYKLGSNRAVESQVWPEPTAQPGPSEDSAGPATAGPFARRSNPFQVRLSPTLPPDDLLRNSR
jgi:hypothetical protein